MAKQRGIHQISGKINDLVYYGQKYVNTGLIRKQNTAMSSRVKTDPEFLNTRRAGAEFGFSSQTAAVIAKLMPQRTSTIVNPFILPRFTRLLYKILKAQDGTQGVRVWDFSDTLVTSISLFLNSMCKRIYAGNFPSVDFPLSVSTVTYSADLYFDRLAVQAFCNNHGFDGIRFTVYDLAAVSVGEPDGNGGYTKSYARPFNIRQRFTMKPEDTTDVIQQYYLNFEGYELSFVMVLAEPVLMVNNNPTYPTKYRSYCVGCVYYKQ